MSRTAIHPLVSRPLPCLRLSAFSARPHSGTVTPQRSLTNLHSAPSLPALNNEPRSTRYPAPLYPRNIILPQATASLTERASDEELKEKALARESKRDFIKGVIKFTLAIGVCACIACLGPNVASAGAMVEPTGFSLMKALRGFIDFVLHLDVHLGAIIAKHGAWTYAFLFTIVFCETGLVLTPFLPGDSLLFVAGALAGIGKLNLFILSATFIVAAVVGDAVNYAIGSWLGERAVENKIISKAYIQKTEKFFESYGGKTIVLARFVPIVRTFAPFVAGMSHMEYQRFAAFNVGGALLWTVLFCGVGFFFGNLPFVEKNFSLVVLAIVAISILPIVYEVLAARGQQTNTPSSPQT